MRRREFITLLGGAAAAVAWPLAAAEQQPERMRRIGVIMAGAENDPLMQILVKGFEQGLTGLGWVNGQNVQIEIRWTAADPNRIQTAAKDLIGFHPDVILAQNTPVVAALRQVSDTLPIVFVNVSDPIGYGFVESMANPRGHVTGFTNFESSMASKWLQILKEIAPHVTRVALMFNPETAPGGGLFFLQPFEAAASAFAVDPIQGPVHSEPEIERVVAKLDGESKGALLVMADAFTTQNRKQIIALAERYRVPTIYPFRYFAQDGGLISYGSSSPDIFHRAASYIDRILRGENPADLPVQAPAKFELTINLKTAKTLGLTIPPTLLAIADEVIE